MFFKLFLLIMFCSSCSAKTKCAKATGKLRCRTDPTKVDNVQIKLIDWDGLPWEGDDQMGMTWSAKDGSFVVSGCGYDMGPWNTPDPYLKIWHYCTSEEGSNHEVGIWPTFLPDEQDVGTIHLDLEE